MEPITSGEPPSTVNTPYRLVVVGAGPKAAALAAKTRVLSELGSKLGIGDAKVKVMVIERNKKVAANWRGKAGFTNGKGTLGTPPEKDVGFPYNSIYGSDVDTAMLQYSWQMFKSTRLDRTSYGAWVDRGRQHPKHEEWARYLDWVLAAASPKEKEKLIEIFTETVVERVVPSGEQLIIDVRRRNRTRPIEADGIVFTGPGEPIMIPKAPASLPHLIFNGKDYWEGIPDFQAMTHGKIALIGGGETAASIALSLLDLALLEKGPVLDIHIINRHGTIFTRGESYGENKLFTDPGEWEKLDELTRREFIQRTDRGVFSVAAQRRLDQEERVNIISGAVLGLEESGGKIIVRLKRGDAIKTPKYDKVVVALGFDPWTPLKMFPEHLRPKVEDEDVRKELQSQIDPNLCVPFSSVTALAGAEPNVHMPMVAGLSQGPGFPNLSCLGHVADRILSRYVKPPSRSKKSKART